MLAAPSLPIASDPLSAPLFQSCVFVPSLGKDEEEEEDEEETEGGANPPLSPGGKRASFRQQPRQPPLPERGASPWARRLSWTQVGVDVMWLFCVLDAGGFSAFPCRSHKEASKVC